MMQTFVRPSRDLRNHYAEISGIIKEHNHVIITNQGRGESVLINIETTPNMKNTCISGMWPRNWQKPSDRLLTRTHSGRITIVYGGR